MPLVRMLTSVAGKDPVTGAEFAWQEGQEVSMPAAQAAVWADGVRGELVRFEPVETPERGGGLMETAAAPSPPEPRSRRAR